jgi:hypothetical protein
MATRVAHTRATTAHNEPSRHHQEPDAPGRAALLAVGIRRSNPVAGIDGIGLWSRRWHEQQARPSSTRNPGVTSARGRLRDYVQVALSFGGVALLLVGVHRALCACQRSALG